MKRVIYFLEAIPVYILFIIIKVIGIDRSSNLGGFIGRNIGPLLKPTQYARHNIKFVFPHLSEKEIQKIILEMWDNFGRTFFEIAHIYRLSKKEFDKRVQIIGLEHLKKATKVSHNIIGVSGHFGNWEVALRCLLEAGLKLTAVYRHLNNPLLNWLMIKQRDPKMMQALKNQPKAILLALKKGRSLAMLCDQKFSEGMPISFFNKPAYTTVAPAKMAAYHNVPIVLARVVRTHGAHFKMVFSEVIYPKDFNNSADVMKRINKVYEEWIQEIPGQWFWLHRRWEKEFYS